MSDNMAPIVQPIGRSRCIVLVYSMYLEYWTFILWSSDTLQNKVSADQYRVTISQAQVYSSLGSHGFFFKFNYWPGTGFGLERRLKASSLLKSEVPLLGYNHWQKSWDKFALLVLLLTGQTWKLLHQPNLLLPQSPIQCWKLLPAICSDFQHCIGWGRGTVTHF